MFNIKTTSNIKKYKPALKIFKDSQILDGESFIRTYFIDKLWQLGNIYLRIFRTDFLKKHRILFPEISPITQKLYSRKPQNILLKFY